MQPRTLKASFFAVVFALLLARVAVAAESADTKVPTAEVMDRQTPAYVLSALQQAHASDANTLVFQDEFDFLIDKDGGGACPSVAAINLLQSLRIMAGLDKLSNPHRVLLASFASQPDLRKGRLTNRQFTNLIDSFAAHLGDTKLTVDVESAPNSTNAEGKRHWSDDGPDLGIQPSRIKVLSYTVTRSNGNVLGRHFVLLKDHRRNEIVVVDPLNPAKDRRYILEFKKADDTKFNRIFLLQPVGVPQRSDLFELNTVFTVSIAENRAGRAGGLGNTAKSIEDIKRHFDETAASLAGTKDFLSPRVWRKTTARFGLPGLDLPIEYGGSAWPATKMVEVFRHAGEHNLNFRDVVGGAHVRPLLNSTHPEIRKIVQQVARGEGYIAIAITEPTAGSDISAIKSSARKVEGGFLLSGTKRFNARLAQATHIVIFTQGTTGKPGDLSVFVVPRNAPGLRIETLTAHGLTGNSYGGLSFTNLFVPDSHLVGVDGEGMRVFFKHFLYWRLMQTAAAIGTGQKALQQMADRIRTREAFGGPIGRFTHLQQPLGQYTTQLRMAFSLTEDAAALIDQGKYREAHGIISGLKAEGVEISLDAVDAAMRAFGGEGYSTMVDLGDRSRDLEGLRIADGTTDVMRMDVVRRTYGEEFWRMAVEPRDRDD